MYKVSGKWLVDSIGPSDLVMALFHGLWPLGLRLLLDSSQLMSVVYLEKQYVDLRGKKYGNSLHLGPIAPG